MPHVPPAPPMPLWRRMREDEWPTLRELVGYVRRLNGCLIVVLLFTLGPFLMSVPVLYPLARSARRQARRVFPASGHQRIHDPDVVRIQKARAWVAAGMSFLLLVAYGRPDDWDQAEQQFFLRLVITPWLLLVSAPVVVAVLLRYVPPAERAAMRGRLRPAVRSAAQYFGAFTGAVALMYVAQLTQGVVLFVVLLPVVWALFFVLFATSVVVRTAFRAAEVHAVLPALLTGVLVWEFAGIGLLTGGMPPGPPLVQVCTVLGGPASVTAVAWFEVRRLRTRYGVTLRG
ncbi:hypothetical protein [Streptomyces mashuensis]|nr:hypothetical protein [Streptomyces mashuensis]